MSQGQLFNIAVNFFDTYKKRHLNVTRTTFQNRIFDTCQILTHVKIAVKLLTAVTAAAAACPRSSADFGNFLAALYLLIYSIYISWPNFLISRYFLTR